MDVFNDTFNATRKTFRRPSKAPTEVNEIRDHGVDYEMRVDLALEHMQRSVSLFEDRERRLATLSNSFADLNAEFLHVQQREEAVVEELHKAIVIIRESNERVAIAEARAVGAESRSSDLEKYVAKLAHQLDRMIGAISTSFGHDALAPAAPRSRDLAMAA